MAETKSPGQGGDSDDAGNLVLREKNLASPNRRKLRVYKDYNLESTSPTTSHLRSSRTSTNQDDKSLRSRLPWTSRSRDSQPTAGISGYRSHRHELTPLSRSLNRSEDLQAESNFFCNSNTTADNQMVEMPTERATQRYFSVTGNEEPQFYDVMPPQMEFGGMVDPRYLGSTLNPLNPIAHARRLRATYTSLMMPPYGTFGTEYR